MTKKIINTSPADNWFFGHSSQGIGGKYPAIFHRVAVWATLESGNTVGLISVFPSVKHGTVDNPLVQPPPVLGGYLHWDDMTEEDRKHAITGCRPGFLK